MKRITREEMQRHQADAARQLEEDAAAAARVLASPGGAALLRYLRRLWGRRGLGVTPEKTAYRVAFRDALEQLEDMAKEGGA